MTYTAGTGTATGIVGLVAKAGTVPHDTGRLNITVAPAAPPPPPPGVAVTQNPGDVVPRGQCLTIALAAAAASECGDLRVVHPLPAVRTMNRWRTPTLVYNSAQAIGWASVAADLTLAASDPIPNTVTAELKIGTVRASGTWAGNQWTAGSTRRIALGFSGPAQGLATGVYDYEFNVTKNNPGGPLTVSATGKLAIVDRSTSYFGAGWWLAGLEQWNSGTGLWIGGDGSVRTYTLRPGSVQPNRVWGAPSVTYPDTIRESGSEFIRQLSDSVWVYFDALGHHIRTRNRQGHITNFAYDQVTSRLVSISVPPSDALSYTFSYQNGKIATIVAPGVPTSRTATLTVNGTTGRLTNILEPDSRTVSFGYDTDNKISSRTDRHGTVTNFQYDAGNHVSVATTNLDVGAITRTLQQASSQGFPGAAVALNNVLTRLDGPLLPTNTTSFYLNRFGAPDTIIDALNQRIWIVRGDARFLGLATQLTTLTGHTINAAYDERGRILTADAPSSTGVIATTRYIWDSKWDQVTRTINPEGDFYDFGIDAATGNRVWQEDARGSSARTVFAYFPDNQVSSVTPPGMGAQSFTYDSKGNLRTGTTALGRQTTWTNNSIGLTEQILTPIGTADQPNWGAQQTEIIQYSTRNEETSHSTTVPDGGNVTVTQTYDEEGNLHTLSRTFLPNPYNVAALTTTWDYDRANRLIRQTEPDGSAERRGVDDAGNLVADTTRTGAVITMSYDALNRLITRTLLGVTYDLPPTQIPSTQAIRAPYSYSWATDNQTFQYSPDGQVTVATNNDATVTRTFHAVGTLMKEVLEIKSWNRQTTHAYATAYTYDLNGRRSTLAAPSQFAGSLIRYGYAPLLSQLMQVTDIAGNTFAINYDAVNNVSRIDFGGSIHQSFGYDGDGRRRSDVIQNAGSQAFPYYPGPQLRNFAVSVRNARDQILSSSDAAQFDQVNATYTGLGYLQTSNTHQNTVDMYTGLPVGYATGDTYTYDGMGNLITSQFADTAYDQNSTTTSSHNGGNGYDANYGRLTAHQDGPDATTYSYNAAGSSYFERTNDGSEVNKERAAYYGPNEVLLATDTRYTGRRRTFEEYRYDALGRRVWVRSVMTCEPSSQSVACNTPYVRRTIWDGAQELAEIQSPVDTTNPGTIEELDTGYSERPWDFSPADPNPFYGRVVYGPGLAVDQPLSVTRYEYRDKPGSNATSLTWPRFTLQIYWNYRGIPAYGTLTTGARVYPYQLGQNQTACPALNLDGNLQRCVQIFWPYRLSAYNRNRGNLEYRSWHGSLLEGKRDRSGLEYMRNREYDPLTGRFTQEDPIGLAGGLNLYGFANGDPVNFSDPFGLRACPDSLKTSGRCPEEPDSAKSPPSAILIALAQHGKQNINMDDPLVRGITKQSSPEEIQAAMERVRQALNSGEVAGARAAALRGWLKVASRGFRVAGVIGILYGVWDAINSIVSPPVACSGTLTGC
ncbi:MAG TPA: RHS repeat-associated core domain-containing protein [Gemmatimonadales bacterium]|nr:RHS repeat-associated core domain-containing protein [Gemmatimonadales bacterium]